MTFSTKYPPHYHYLFFSMFNNYFCILITWIWCYYLTILTYDKFYTRFRHFLAVVYVTFRVCMS